MAITTPPTAPLNAKSIKEHPVVWFLLELLGLMFLAGIVALGYRFKGYVLFGSGSFGFTAEVVAFLVGALYLILSVVSVKAEEIAGAYCYGFALVGLESGPKFAPFGLMQIRREPRDIQNFQAPDEPELVFKGDDSAPLPMITYQGKLVSMVRPIRVVSRAPTDTERGILDAQMTLTISFVFQYQIVHLFNFVANLTSKENVEKQLRDIGETLVAETMSVNTPAGFIAQLATTNAELARRTQDRFENTGVLIISARMISPDVSHGVSSSLSDVTKARAEARALSDRSEGEKTRLTNEGAGRAAAELALLKAQAEGGAEKKKQLGVDGQDILAAEVATSVLEKTDVLLAGSSGMADVAGLAKAALAAFGKTGGTSVTPPTP